MKLIRIAESHFEDGVRVFIHDYEVMKETPCGYWISVYGQKRWVSKSTRKRFAHVTLDEAIKSFRARKARQIRILERQLSNARLALNVPVSDYGDCRIGFEGSNKAIAYSDHDLDLLHSLPAKNS